MNDKLLPRIQLVLALLFGLAAVIGPMLTAEARRLILGILGIGLLLGAVTVAIGVRLVMQRQPVTYPFFGWSLGVLKAFVGEKQVRPLRKARRGPTPEAMRVLGIASLVLGGLLVLAMIAVGVLVFFPLEIPLR